MFIPFRPLVAALCGLVLCAALAPVRAEESAAELPAVVVTGTRTEKPLLESPVRTEAACQPAFRASQPETQLCMEAV